METTEGYDPAVWKQMANELGLQSLHIPEEYGGQGFTFVELGIVLEEMGRALLCAPYFSTVVLAANAILNAGTDDQKERAAARHRVAARRSPRSRSPSRTASGTRRASRWRPSGRRRLHARRHEDVRDRRPHRRPHRRGRPHRRHHAARTASRSSPSPATRPGLTRTAARDDGPDPQAGPARVLRRRGRSRSATPGAGWAALSQDARPGRGRPLATRWSAARSSCSRCRSSTPRTACSSVGRSARSRRSSTSAPTCCSRSSRRKSAAYYAAWAAAEDNDELPVVASPGQGVLLRRVLPRRGREHPDPRWHRLHLGAQRAPVLQAREDLGDPARRRHLPPRAARPAHRHLSEPRSYRTPGGCVRASVRDPS